MFPRTLTALVLVSALLVSTASYAQNVFDNAVFLKPPPPGQTKGDTIKGMLLFDSMNREVQFARKGGSPELSIKYETITSMLYERTAKPRYGLGLLVAWPLLFTKSKKHYLTFHFTGPGTGGQFVIIQLHKGNFQMALATAEAEIGKKIERAEER